MRRPVTSGRLSTRPVHANADFTVVVQTDLTEWYNATHLAFQEQPVVVPVGLHVGRDRSRRRQPGVKNELSVAPEFHLGWTGRGERRSDGRHPGNRTVIGRHSD